MLSNIKIYFLAEVPTEESEIREMINQVDSAGKSGSGASDQVIRKHFQDADKDGNGFISAAEFRQWGGTEEMHFGLDAMFRKADSDEDDQLSYEEFHALVIRLLKVKSSS